MHKSFYDNSSALCHKYGITHWGRVLYVGNLTIIGSDNGLAPDRRQAIIWINAGILLFGRLGTKWHFNRLSYIFI